MTTSGSTAHQMAYAPDFLMDTPVVDVAAALVGAGFEAKLDHDEGWSWTHAALAHGSWDVVKGTGKSIADDAKGLWHGVTSLF
ncbi:hypothetical protein [Streptacidiphilus melanogenes]|uniref:hypothetical protein n=1 Tax=Streptacidiphilus melanogenes TaxID=411235 RepID=UPI0005A91B96|nr:hypothetical protein [Streptacidiphilus melanogenes]